VRASLSYSWLKEIQEVPSLLVFGRFKVEAIFKMLEC
jgi:hypothetical protein